MSTNEAQAIQDEDVDVDAASLNGASDDVIDYTQLTNPQKYEVILDQVKQNGSLFFTTVSPTAFDLPQQDPLNLIWLNMITSWKIAANILGQFEQALIAEAATTETEVEGEENVEATSTE